MNKTAGRIKEVKEQIAKVNAEKRYDLAEKLYIEFHRLREQEIDEMYAYITDEQARSWIKDVLLYGFPEYRGQFMRDGRWYMTDGFLMLMRTEQFVGFPVVKNLDTSVAHLDVCYRFPLIDFNETTAPKVLHDDRDFIKIGKAWVDTKYLRALTAILGPIVRIRGNGPLDIVYIVCDHGKGFIGPVRIDDEGGEHNE